MPKTCKQHQEIESESCPYCALNQARRAVRAWKVRWDVLRADVAHADHWPLSRDILERLEEDYPVPDVVVDHIN